VNVQLYHVPAFSIGASRQYQRKAFIHVDCYSYIHLASLIAVVYMVMSYIYIGDAPMLLGVSDALKRTHMNNFMEMMNMLLLFSLYRRESFGI